jgi:hypothetical protein
MVDAASLWNDSVDEVRRAVTGVGVWTALKLAVPIAYENGTFILGLPQADSELAGHLRVPHTKRQIENALALQLNERVELRIIHGTRTEDWDLEKRRDLEKRKLQEQALDKARKEATAAKSWEGIYEQLSRAYAATPSRSLPQNRAKFFLEAVNLVAEALVETPITDDMAERNYARCLERIASYSDLPSTFVAVKVLERTFGG